MKPIQEYAHELVGNWQRWESFACSEFDDVPQSDDYCIVYTCNRESTLLDQSNHACIQDRLKPFLNADAPEGEESIWPLRHSHWACGWVGGYAIRVFDDAGGITPVFREWYAIQSELDAYPILDEDDYSNRECEATWENVCNQVKDCIRRYEFITEPEYSEDLAEDVLAWLNENEPGALENRDDQGGFPDDDDVLNALEALGFPCVPEE